MSGIRLIPSYDLGSDEGYWNYFHSPYKRELAERILRLVLADMYGIGTAGDALAPEPAEITLSEDKTYITIRFDNVGEGLKANGEGGEVSGFTLGKLSKLTAVKAEIISKDTVKVYVPEKTTPNAVGYAIEKHIKKGAADLCSSFDVPALAFHKSL